MNIEKAKKESQIRKFETTKIELQIKVAERLEDIARIEKLINEQDETIEKVRIEIEKIGE